MVTLLLAHIPYSFKFGVCFPPLSCVHRVCTFFQCFGGFPWVLQIPPQTKDMHFGLIGISKLSVVCEHACECRTD